MKNLKFKVWNKIINKMFTNIKSINYENNNPVEIGYIGNKKGYDIYTYELVENVILLQYINEFDKTGSEICEGDIVEKDVWFATDDMARGGYKYTGYIKYIDAKFIISSEYDFNGFYDNIGELFTWGELTVIGNIYENPELV